MQPRNRGTRGETYIKTLGLLSEAGAGMAAAEVDVNNGKIVRIRPMNYDGKVKTDEVIPITMEAHGNVYKQNVTKALLAPHHMSYKKRVYSPNRILYPLKRGDWSPDGDRNAQNRGKSKYERISWDEALDIIVKEINRIIKEYGASAILAQADGHGETKVVHPAHACNTLLLKHLGGYTLQCRNPDSWEGAYWGAKHTWGMEPVGLESGAGVVNDVALNTNFMVSWADDSDKTSWISGQTFSNLMYWFTELGIKNIFICPDLNYTAAVHADKWIPILPGTDAALALAIVYTWIIEGTYDKDYVTTHTVGFDKFEEYVLGKKDGIPKTPNWASQVTGVPSRIIKALAKEWASKTTVDIRWFRRNRGRQRAIFNRNC